MLNCVCFCCKGYCVYDKASVMDIVFVYAFFNTSLQFSSHFYFVCLVYVHILSLGPNIDVNRS